MNEHPEVTITTTHPARSVTLVKGGGLQKGPSIAPTLECDTMCAAEILRRFNEFERAYLALRKVIKGQG